MRRYWTDRQIDAVTPPQVHNDRDKAYLRTLGQMFEGNPIEGLRSRNPMTCHSSALPALIAEMSMEEFLTPDLPEFVVRRILQHGWSLKALKGYDAGVRAGLALLGMQLLIKHWHQEKPIGPANTQTITFLVGETLFDEEAVLGPRIINAAHRMISATKRFSQESAIRIGVNMQRKMGFKGGAASIEILRGTAPSKPPPAFKVSSTIYSAATALTIVRAHAASPTPKLFAAKTAVTSHASILEIHRVSAKAA